jgi:ComF family protein
VLHAFKFGRHDFLAAPLASLLATTIRDRGFDAIVPVPMHPSRQRRRGYNQAELLATALAEAIAIPCRPRLLRKTKEKATQSTLARADRAANVRGVFEGSDDAHGLALLLVDDVCTTGETVRACAGALLSAGAARVCAISVAKAI